HNNGKPHADSEIWEVAILPEFLASELGVKTGDVIHLRLAINDAIPRESLLGRRGADPYSKTEVPAVVAAIVPNDSLIAGFQLAPGTTRPRNIQVAGSLVDNLLQLHGKVNTVLVRSRGVGVATLDDRLRAALSFDDWGITLTQTPTYLAIESKQT